jgi:hypothetical protein
MISESVCIMNSLMLWICGRIEQPVNDFKLYSPVESEIIDIERIEWTGIVSWVAIL